MNTFQCQWINIQIKKRKRYREKGDFLQIPPRRGNPCSRRERPDDTLLKKGSLTGTWAIL